MSNNAPFTFIRREGEQLSIAEAIGQALGAASTCWIGEVNSNAEFDSARASHIGDVLLGFVNANLLRETQDLADRAKRLREERDAYKNALAVQHAKLTEALLAVFPKEFTPEMLAVGEETTVERVVRKLHELHDASLTAIYLSNTRLIRGLKFMEPETFAEIYYKRYTVYYQELHGTEHPSWDKLSKEHQDQMTELSRRISEDYLAAIEGKSAFDEGNPAVNRLLEEGRVLTNALNAVANLPHRQALGDLDTFLRSAFPKQVVVGDDAELDAVRRAIELLTFAHTYVPMVVKFAWENVVRPSIHALDRLGIEILPPGTIVYGAEKKDT